MAGKQIDLEGSLLRKAAVLAGSLGFVAVCGGLLYARPSAGRPIDAGSFAEFALYLGLVVFGFFAIVAAIKLVRSGTVVSVGPRGVFDRRLSSDWISWDTIQAVSEAEMNRQRWLALHIDPARDASLPIRTRARILARLNEPLGFPGYPISPTELKGGFPALVEAFRQGQPRSD